MPHSTWDYQRFRLRHLFDRAIWLDLLLFALLLYGLYLLGQSIGGWKGTTALTAILTTVNALLVTSVIYLWLKLLWRRLPLWLAVGGVVLTLWGLSARTLSLPAGYIAGPEVGPQLLVTLLGIGLLGTVIALTEITRPAFIAPKSRYLAMMTRRGTLPSFTGFGALIINSVLRVCRNRFFIAMLAVFLVTLLAKNTATFDAGSNMALLTAGSITLTITITHCLAPFSSSLTTKFPGLPATRPMIDFAATIAGLLITAIISWTVCFGLLRLDVVSSIWLTVITLTGQVIAFIVAASARKIDRLGAFGSWWIVIIEIVALFASYQTLAEINLTGNLLVLLVVVTALFSTTFYQTGSC